MENYLLTSIKQEISKIYQRFTRFRDTYDKMTDTEFRERVTELIDSIFDYMFFIAQKVDQRIPETHMFREELILQLKKQHSARPAIVSDVCSFYLRQVISINEEMLSDRRKTFITLERARRQWENDLRRYYESIIAEAK